MTSSANPCQAFFEKNAQTENKSAELVKSGVAIGLEALSASPHSPGPVENEEHVLRLVVNPIHINLEDGSLKPTLMSDVKLRGASVQRLAYIFRDTVIDMGRQNAERKNAGAGNTGQERSVYGTVELSVKDIREVVIATKDRAFGVFDTAKQLDPSHADVFLIVSDGQGARSARLQLMVLANRGFQAA